MGFRFIPLLLTLLLFSTLPTKSSSQTFKCSSPLTCRSLIDYISPNTTTLSHIKTLFSIKNLRSILGANNLSLSTLPNFTIPAKHPIKIPFTCLCINNTGLSNKQPIYTVQKDDGLYHIAAEVFSGLVTYQEIAAVNNVTDVNLIEVGQKLWIPLPCSCDDVDGVKVVHYGHVVEAGSSLEVIAQEYGTSRNTLMKLNGIANGSSLLAGQVLDVPLQGQYVLPSCAICVNTCAGNQSLDSARQCAMALILYAVRIFDSYFPTLSLGKQGRGSNLKLLRERACNSSVRSDSVDSPFLVPNYTYFFTANNCVKCKCDAANNWILQCEPSGNKPSNWSTCPAMQCEGGSLTIGNTTTSGCNTTTCAYAGFSRDQRIFTTLATQSTCTAPGGSPGNFASRIGLSRNYLFICIHMILLLVNLL
ncbi:hypothetical protein POTOM_034976 [Populus tomentosa]|uniref:LysM domain-containing protein n=1 Tax=Populus tomentosa TaxID=118781 RepID=A0A8X7YZU7_POPTO|nr:hypothetical protein POTOM_034976 [Populus tomentosa]